VIGTSGDRKKQIPPRRRGAAEEIASGEELAVSDQQPAVSEKQNLLKQGGTEEAEEN